MVHLAAIVSDRFVMFHVPILTIVLHEKVPGTRGILLDNNGPQVAYTGAGSKT